MEGLNLNTFLSIVVPWCLYFVLTLAGAFLKDVYNTLIKKDVKFRLSRVLIGAVSGAFIMIGLEDILLTKVGVNQIITISFIIGTVSFELFNKISKLDTVLKYVKLFNKFIKENNDNDDKEDGDE
nr:MAG TPA: hypothetical protein [Caudoviricetes sp.]